MRTVIILTCLFLSMTSCEDSKKEKESTKFQDQTSAETNHEDSEADYQEKTSSHSSNSETEEFPVEKKNKTENAESISGLYLNKAHSEDSSCACYCIDITTSGTSELCLKENELFINARFEPDGNNLNVYFDGKSSKSVDNNIPWKKFETGTPIAVASTEPNGDLKLDWKGFSIDGKIAVDYALYGKKTLEGTYKKK